MSGLTGLFVALDGTTGTVPKGARHALGGLLELNGASPLDVRTGVLLDTQVQIVTGTAGWSYDIRAFAAVLAASVANGPTVCVNDGTVNVLTDPAPGSNSRIDLIWCRQQLLAGDGGVDTDNLFIFGVEKGAAAPVPAVPATPAGALALATVVVPAGAPNTSGLTFTRVAPYTVARGGVLPVLTAADLALLTPHVGQAIYDGSTATYKEPKWWDGSAWKTAAHLKPAFSAYKSAAQAVATGTITSMAFGAEEFDTDNGHDLVTQTARYTCQRAGLYRFSGCLTFESNSTGRRVAIIQKNGADTRLRNEARASTGGSTGVLVTGLLSLAVGDYVNLAAFHDAGVPLDVTVASTWFDGEWVRP